MGTLVATSAHRCRPLLQGQSQQPRWPGTHIDASRKVLQQRLQQTCGVQCVVHGCHLQRRVCVRAGSAEPRVSTQQKVLAFLDANFLILGLSAALLAGLVFPGTANSVARANVGPVVTTAIFIMSGLQMRQGQAAQALEHWQSFALGLVTILFVTPLVGALVLAAPIRPAEFAYGLAVFCCMPTSLSANIALSGAVGANQAMSILLTSTSNVLAVFTMPHVVCAVLASSKTSLSLDAAAMVMRLVKSVLVPLMVRSAVDGNKKLLRNASTLCLAIVPFSQLGTARANGSLDALDWRMAGTLLVCICGALTAIRLFNVLVFQFEGRRGIGRRGAVPVEVTRAVILAANQKTLPTCIAVIAQLGDVIGSGVALATVASVLAHFMQVVFDSLLMQWWQRQDRAALPRAAPA